MRTKDFKASYWKVVEDCLQTFHCLPPGEARKLAKQLRDKVESHPRGMASRIFYHAEPFDVACDLAQKQLSLAEHRTKYEEILAHRGY